MPQSMTTREYRHWFYARYTAAHEALKMCKKLFPWRVEEAKRLSNWNSRTPQEHGFGKVRWNNQASGDVPQMPITLETVAELLKRLDHEVPAAIKECHCNQNTLDYLKRIFPSLPDPNALKRFEGLPFFADETLADGKVEMYDMKNQIIQTFTIF